MGRDTVIGARVRDSQKITTDRASPISAVVIPCAGKKRIRPNNASTAVSVRRGPQSAVEKAWLETISSLPAEVEAGALYSSRSFGLARETARGYGAALFIISAGLGFLPGERRIPVYGLTVSGRGPESAAVRTEGQFTRAAWWDAVARGPYSVDIATCLDGPEDGLVLLALTQPYAEMIGSAFATAVEGAEHRVRIFGRGIGALLPTKLAESIMPYDDRLDVLIPGTRTDFSHRALRHFAHNVANSEGGVLQHRQLVLSAMDGVVAPARPKRPRVPDDAIIARIHEHLKTTTGIGRTLRRLRDFDAIACEQSRFTRLYRIAARQGAQA